MENTYDRLSATFAHFKEKYSIRVITIWWRCSLLVILIHTIVLGLTYDWELFSLSKNSVLHFNELKNVSFLPNELFFIGSYPRILDVLIIPVLSGILLFMMILESSTDIYPILCLIAGIIVVFAVIINGYDVTFSLTLVPYLCFLFLSLLTTFTKEIDITFNNAFISGALFGLVYSVFLGVTYGILTGLLGYLISLLISFTFGLFCEVGTLGTYLFKKKKIHIKVLDFFIAKDMS